MSFGYFFEIAGRRPLIPVAVGLVAIDPATGEALRVLAEEADGSEGFTVVARDQGDILATHGAITTTAVAALAPLVEPLLTDGRTVLRPRGGLEAFTPAG